VEKVCVLFLLLCGISKISSECQKTDWPSHKATCRSLKGGTWHTINFDRSSPMSRFILNRNDIIDSKKSESLIENIDTTTVTPNVHGDSVFLVKLQISFFPVGEDANMLIYDRQKSFQEFWKRKDSPELFDDAEEMMGDKLKIYRYARRVGDLQLSLCLDRKPPQDPAW